MATAPKPAPTLKVKVARAFYYQGKPLAVDTEIDLPAVFAREMIAAHKAVAVATPAPAPVTTAGPDDDKTGDDKTPSNPGRRGK